MQLHTSLLRLIWISLALTTPNASYAQDASGYNGGIGEFCQNLPRPQYAELDRIASPDNWFELYKVADGVTALYEPFQWQEVISYLIEGNERALLYDTGNGIADIAAVAKSLTEKPITVLNSHSHYDHVGGNYAFGDVLGLDTEFTRTGQLGHNNADIRIEASAIALCAPLPTGVTEATHLGRPFEVTERIKDGHKIDLGGRTLEVISIPGHTPDAIALHDKEAKLLFTGDSFYAGPIWLYAPETDLAQYRKSLETLNALDDVDTLLPAHNTPLVDASILPQALVAFDDMLAGKLTKVPQWESTVAYELLQDAPFSFLMRDEPLPYKKNNTADSNQLVSKTSTRKEGIQ